MCSRNRLVYLETVIIDESVDSRGEDTRSGSIMVGEKARGVQKMRILSSCVRGRVQLVYIQGSERERKTFLPGTRWLAITQNSTRRSICWFAYLKFASPRASGVSLLVLLNLGGTGPGAKRTKPRARRSKDICQIFCAKVS
jgi:hypothetical protein